MKIRTNVEIIRCQIKIRIKTCLKPKILLNIKNATKGKKKQKLKKEKEYIDQIRTL